MSPSVITIGEEGEAYLILSECSKKEALEAFQRFEAEQMFLYEEELCDYSQIKQVMVKITKNDSKDPDYEADANYYDWSEEAKGDIKGWLLEY